MQKAEEGFPSQVKILTGFQSGDLELDEGEWVSVKHLQMLQTTQNACAK
jgi:hypothetical protein